jgi:hypothetical protein
LGEGMKESIVEARKVLYGTLPVTSSAEKLWLFGRNESDVGPMSWTPARYLR